MSKARDYRRELEAIIEEVAESVIALPDAAIVEEVRESGEDPDAVAERAKARMLEAVRAFRRSRLASARAEYEEKRHGGRASDYPLPEKAEDRRSLLGWIFDRAPDLRTALLTAQHRGFTSLRDEDVESYLKQLAELGVIDALGRGQIGDRREC